MKDDISLDSINVEEYDFLDFGCSHGNGLLFGVDKFEAKNGIGVDIDPVKVRQARTRIKKGEISKQHTVICEDITKLSQYKNLNKKVRFTTCIHFLEHVPGYGTTEKIIESAINASNEFVYINQPFADKDVELFNMGLKTYYSDWTDHINLLTSYDFYKICRNFFYKKMIKDFIIFGNVKIESSNNPLIHPLDSPINQHEYDKEIHPPKDENIKFNNLYKNIGIFLIIDDTIPIETYFNRIYGEKDIIYDSRKELELEIKDVKLEYCDFVDLGTGRGNGLIFGVQKFGGKTGLGIDKNPDRIEQVLSRIGDFKEGFGFHKILQADILELNTEDVQYYKQFNFVNCINVVEELEKEEDVALLIKKCSDLAKKFAFISHVNNDYDEYLKSLSLQTNIRRSPKNHVFLSSKDYIKLLNRLKSEDVIKNFEIYKRKPISDSSSNNIVSLTKKPKEIVDLDDVYTNIDIFIFFDENMDSNELSKRMVGEKNMIYSSINDI